MRSEVNVLLRLEPNGAELVQHKRVVAFDVERLLIEAFGQLQVVAQRVLEADVQEGQEAALHDLSGGEVGRRGLVVLRLLSERVAERQPRRRERSVQACRFSAQVNIERMIYICINI